MLTREQARITVRSWPDRKLRRKLWVAERLWPTDYRTEIMRDELARRQEGQPAPYS